MSELLHGWTLSMDSFELVFAHQKAYQRYRNRFLGEDKIADSKELALLLHSEITDLLDGLGWKPHHLARDKVLLSNVKEGIVDIFKYLLILSNVWGMNTEDIVQEYFRKSSVVEQRWKQDFELNLKSAKCVCVDIDGVLCDYVATWLRFLQEKNIAIKEHVPNTLDLSATLYYPNQYPSLKNEFRESGQKANAIIVDGAKELLQFFNAQQYTIVLVSARPAHQYQRIYADTIEWLKKNQLFFDALFFEADKRDWVVNNVQNVAFCIEDSPEQVLRLSRLGLFVFVPNREYNKDVSGENIYRVETLYEIIEKVKEIEK
mgnify:CR=1 FL=1